MQTSLFEAASAEASPANSGIGLLSKDGHALYIPSVFDENSCDALFASLLNTVSWKEDQLVMFGKLITTKRKVAWVGDAGCSYTYSGVKKFPQAWTPALLEIKQKVEALAQHTFNSCLLNLYHDGSEGMGWHSDDEKELEQAAPIASVSFGGERKFAFKHKFDRTSVSLTLANGSVLLMHAPTQQSWQHSLTKTKRPVGPRINLTFRAIRHDNE
jgi:alkylated DNA repair dioxygenase AlkB